MHRPALLCTLLITALYGVRLCFSLVSDERTLDFACPSLPILFDWYLALASHMPPRAEDVLNEEGAPHLPNMEGTAHLPNMEGTTHLPDVYYGRYTFQIWQV